VHLRGGKLSENSACPAKKPRMDSTYRRKSPAIELSKVPYIFGFLFSIFLSNPFLIFFSVKKLQLGAMKIREGSFLGGRKLVSVSERTG